MKHLLGVLAGIVLFSGNLMALEVYSCDVVAESSLTYEPKIRGFEGSTETRKPSKLPIVFMIDTDKAVLKGNAGTVTLHKMSDKVFLESTGANIIVWRVARKNKSLRKTYITSVKAYDILDIAPVTYTTIWQCS